MACLKDLLSFLFFFYKFSLLHVAFSVMILLSSCHDRFLQGFLSFCCCPQVCQWMSDRVTSNSSPVSPSTSSYTGPSPTSDWSTLRREKSSPLRGPHGKFVSPSSFCGYSSSCSPSDQATPQRPRGDRHADMAELAKHVSEPLDAVVTS